jgi:hypothetical protein
MNECAFLEASLETVPRMSYYNVASLQCVEEDMEREKKEKPGMIGSQVLVLIACLLTHGELKPAVMQNTNIPQNISLYVLSVHATPSDRQPMNDIPVGAF